MLGQEAQGRPVSTDRSVSHVPISTRGSTLAGMSVDVAREFQVSHALPHLVGNSCLTWEPQRVSCLVRLLTLPEADLHVPLHQGQAQQLGLPQHELRQQAAVLNKACCSYHC